MRFVEVDTFRSAEYDLWLGRRPDGELLLDGFLKVGGDLKHLVWEVDDAKPSSAVKLIERHGQVVERPYLLGGKCDSSIDAPVFALYLDFCTRHGLGAQELYTRAYPEAGALEPEAITTFAHWQGVRIPHIWTAACYAGLLASLTEINNHMLRSVLEEAAEPVVFPGGVMERGGYVAFRGATRTYGPEARFTWGYVITPTGEHYWRYDPWQSKNGVVPKHYWLSFIAVAAGQDGNLELKRRVVEEALSLARSPENRKHYAWWLGSLGLKAA